MAFQSRTIALHTRSSRAFLSDTSSPPTSLRNMAQCGSSSVVSAADVQALVDAVSTKATLAEEHAPQLVPPLATGGSSGRSAAANV